MKTNILFTIPNFITAGSGRAMLNIIERLDPEKYAPAVCVSQKGGKLDKVVEAMDIPFLERSFTIPAKPYHSLYGRACEVARPFKPYNFHLWHSFHYLNDYTEAIIARLVGAKWVYTKKNMNWHNRAWHVRTLLATRVAAQNTDMMRDFFANPLYRRKTQLTPRGVVTERFKPNQPAALCLREKYGLDPDSVLVGCVAQLLPVKGHPHLIQAVADLPQAVLFLAGRSLDELYAAQLKQQVDELGLTERIIFLDFVEDVPAFLAEIDIFVLPTLGHGRMEGCPVALLEAMASAKPCIATDIPGSRDLVENGKSGILVMPENSEALANALKQLIRNSTLAKELSEQAYARVQQRFTIEKEVSLHEKLYAEIL